MIKFIHHLLNPHCPDCKEDKLEEQICESCNTLRIENAQLRKHNDQLIEALLDKVKPIEHQQEVIVQQPVNLGKTGLSWAARRQLLESEDRASAKILRDKKKEMEAIPVTSVDKLEEELEVNHAV